MTFLFGIAVACLDVFPDLKARTVGGKSVEVHNLKGSSKTVVAAAEGEEDPSMILSAEEIKNNIQPSKEEKNQQKNHGAKKRDTSKVMNNEKKSIYDDNWDPDHNCPYECKSDRIGNEVNLNAGEALCNRQYRFGMTKDGDFLAHDCQSNAMQVFYSSPYNKGDKKGEKVPKIYFKLKQDGTFRVVTEEENKEKKTLYEHKPKRKVYYQAQCLDKPALSCPYLHLRETGLVVINWIDKETNVWMDRYVDKIYPQLYPKNV